ncbi:hypothetical protein C1925_15245 [Stenotrophomonas sp. SAU14A_NAIMI4_5]|nr:hypothetical protein C1925_15245 [Stenotrophomonas sp. SAU14A_NAIMI4_5]
MDGSRLRSYWSAEVAALLDTYTNFERLMPSATGIGSANHGEDGRYVEALITSCLKRHLPKGLEILNGFILRPAVITGTHDASRQGQDDKHSTQLDIVVYDSERYPTFQRFNDTAIVLPEGVVAVVSVKKHLRPADVTKQLKTLRDVAQLCSLEDHAGTAIRGPFLALVGMRACDSMAADGEKAMSRIKDAYSPISDLKFDEMVGFVGALGSWSITKRRPAGAGAGKARFQRFKHPDKKDAHLALQFLLSGILSVYYEGSRGRGKRPGYTAFESGNHGVEEQIDYAALR